MKNFTLSIAMLLLSTIAFAGNCIKVTAAVFTNPSNDGTNWILTINWEADGQKYMYVTVKVNGTPVPGISNNCFSVNAGGGATGTKIYTGIVAPGGIPALSATFERFTGNCGTGSSCGYTQVIPLGGGTLPIKISSFYTKRNGNNVTLNWKSETEINAKEFIIERNMGNGFAAIGTIAALNNAEGASYSFVDNNNSKTVSEYRLKLVDLDATFKLSETRAVKGTGAVSDFTVYPNPSSNGRVNVVFEDGSVSREVSVMDMSGRMVKQYRAVTNNNITIDNLTPGMYSIRIFVPATGEQVVEKIVVNKR